MSNDKLHIIIILGMIGFFIYWYQNCIDNQIECKRCIQRDRKKRKKYKKIKGNLLNSKELNTNIINKDLNKNIGIIKKEKKTVRFEDEESEISLDSLDSSDKVESSTLTDESESCDTLDI